MKSLVLNYTQSIQIHSYRYNGINMHKFQHKNTKKSFIEKEPKKKRKVTIKKKQALPIILAIVLSTNKSTKPKLKTKIMKLTH